MISRELALKGGAGLAAAASGSLGIWWLADHIQNQMTKFDRELINFLGGDGKIKFAVTKDNRKLSGFPELSENLTISVVVKTNEADEDTDGLIKNGEKSQKLDLKKIIDKDVNNEWAWKCEIKLNRNKEVGNAKDLKDKEVLFKESESEGFLNKLRKEGNKDLKIKFIENCARARGKNKNREINNKTWDLEDSSILISSEKIFNLRKGDGKANEDATKLYFEEEKEFKDWFQ